MHLPKPSPQFLIKLLKICAACVFFGRAYEHIFWDAPYRSLLWDQALFSPVVEGIFGMDWNSYVTDAGIDYSIQYTIMGIGVFYVLCGVLSLIIKKKSARFIKCCIAIGAILLILLAVLQAKSRFYHISMFLEHSIQFCSPLILLLFVKHIWKTSNLILLLKIIIAATFISHGLYAVGWPYPLPGNFVTMTINILHLSESAAKTFLLIAGFLDFLMAIMLFIPRLSKVALLYAFIWGTLTAFARIVSGMTYDISFAIMHQYFYTTVYRIPHGLLPLFTFYLLRSNTKSISSNYS
tara:strand:- start:8628 stop:9509 length:882 start_codon:yes stop_codon:yes gene_type:complete